MLVFLPNHPEFTIALSISFGIVLSLLAGYLRAPRLPSIVLGSLIGSSLSVFAIHTLMIPKYVGEAQEIIANHEGYENFPLVGAQIKAAGMAAIGVVVLFFMLFFIIRFLFFVLKIQPTKYKYVEPPRDR